ncbi:LysR family transcriptional regulator [Gallaecimonas pentaromativorans]|uniref:LysR family transcriptional regulator n=1 Tax=Gallaecimonas pentaromativorans TaxID=584787 RepID=A0A3N1PFK9_9GAMM|nr:LysR family transcriptional regulator [Gallaecimonas pentaromativorans]ROQ25797.1 LysR family transcriptional regulator [Gallaecimonas pentaromativorans]
MSRESYSDLLAFIAVAKERSFTRAAASLGISQSALSHTIRKLEERLGIRLLTRTTRSVSPTQAGERLLTRVAPHFEEIDAELAGLNELKEKASGSIRISASDHAIDTILWPKLAPFLKEHPDIHVELNSDYGLTDIVEHRFDAGVRFGERLGKDMIAVRIGADLRMAAVASPEYLASHGHPKTPQDLVKHNCINLRLPTYGGLYAWELEKGERQLNVNVQGQLVFNGVLPITRAAMQGFGIAFLPEDCFTEHIEDGALVRLLEDWCPPFTGYHLYYPNRRLASPVFDLVLEQLRVSSR